MTTNRYIPALKFNWMTGFYDKIISVSMPESKFRKALIKAAFSHSNEAICLEFGVGTASNAILAKQLYPNIQLTGVDVDPQILKIAKNKVATQQNSISLIQYDGKKLPFENQKFDVIYSSLVFHHLMPEQKSIVFQELYRVLNKNGELVFIDWGKPVSIYAKLAFPLLRLFDGWKNTSDNASGNYLNMLESAGFTQPKRIAVFETMYGTLELIKTKK